MITYIKKSIPGHYMTLAQPLDPTTHDNVGDTYEHYLHNWWVLLSDEQVAFHEANPEASVEEVIEMQLKEIQEVDEVKKLKEDLLLKIDNYDRSDSVNSFILNEVIKSWFTVQERLNYKQSVEAAKLLGEETLEFLIEGMILSVSTAAAEYMLAQIQRYADKCYMVTQQHKANVNALTTEEELQNYDYTQDYPEMLKFEL